MQGLRKTAMGEENDTGHDFWQEHSLTFLEMAFRTDRRQRPPKPSGIGHNVGACGDSITLYVTLRDAKVQAVAFELNGCLHTAACANAVAQIVEGRDLEAAWRITPDMVADYLQTLPADHFHCAELAVGAFYRALTDVQQKGGKEWQAAYRRPA